MSDSGSSVLLRRTVASNCKKGVVKDLILEFEQFKVNYKIENGGMLRMGADQSSLTKLQGSPRPRTISSTSLVKQRVSQFDYKLDGEVQSDKKKRQKSIAENNKSQATSTKDFQRSKSYDYVRREKDRYSRGRQATPKINEEAFKFEVPHPKTTSNGDSNNNSLRKSSHRRKPLQKTTAETENKRDIKTNLKPQQLQAPEIATQEKDKQDCAEARVIRKDTSHSEKRNGTISRGTIRRPARSVKSIKQIFEGSEPKPKLKTIKKEPLSNSDTITNGDDNKNKVGSITHTATDKEVSEAPHDNKIPKNSEKYVQDENCDKNKDTSNDVNKTSEGVRKNTLNGVAEAFNKYNSYADFPYICSEDEFDLTENSFQKIPNKSEKYVQDEKCDKIKNISDDANKASEGVGKNNVNGVAEAYNKCNSYADFPYICGEDEFDLTENSFQKTPKNSEKNVQDEKLYKNKNTSDDANNTSEGVSNNNLNGTAEASNKYHSHADLRYNLIEDELNLMENSFQEINQTIEDMKKNSNDNLAAKDEEGARAEPIEDQSKSEDLEQPEYVNVYVRSGIEDELEDEFGKSSFINFENHNLTEVYNQDGGELIIRRVSAKEYRSLYENFTNKDSLVLKDFSDTTDPMGSSVKEYRNVEIPEENPLEETTSLDDELDNAIDNKLYFSVGEIQDTGSEVPSNRSTLYSSTTTNSTESIECYSKAESDEGVDFEKENGHIYEEIRLESNVEIRTTSGGGFDRPIKTETIYDSFQNPRIAKVSNVNSEECATNAESPVVEEAEPVDALKSPGGLKPRKDYLIEELIDTEKKYINHLEKVVWDYMPAITDEKLPPSLIGKSRYLFGNIKNIYDATQAFYRALQLCGTDHEEIAKMFFEFKYLFRLYPLYSKNKPRADQYLLGDFKEVISAREKVLNDRLGLASNLLTPIQRLGKYILFLEQIQKELSKIGFPSANIAKAVEIVRKEMSRGNDYIAIDSIKDCPFSLLEQGSFVMREKFNVIKPRKYEAMVFLFDKILVFTTVDPKNQEMFVFRDSINLNEMGIITFDDQPLVFHLKRFPSYKKGAKELNQFVIEAKKNKDKKTWTEQIEKRLWEQLVKCKEKQSKMHSDQGKRTSVTELPDRIRRKKPGYSSLPSEMRKMPRKSTFYCEVDRDT